MQSDDWGLVIFIAFVVWLIVVVVGSSYLSDVQRGRIPTGEFTRYGTNIYYPAEDVSAERWLRLVFWPVTLVLLAPLGIWLILKAVAKFFAGIGSIYKENA